MTLEEKIKHLQEASMQEARNEGNQIIQSHKDALEQIYEDHKAEATRQSEIRIKSETLNVKQTLNKEMSKAQTEFKREQGKCQNELKTRLFDEVELLVIQYMKTTEYKTLLETYIKKILDFSNNEATTIYINASDSAMKADLEAATGATLTVSTEDFLGGVRGVIRDRNILLDHSFKNAIEIQREHFLFAGGENIA